MSKSEGQVLDFEKICRLCLLEKRSMSSIFAKKKSDKRVPLPVRIMSCASLELYEGDGLPASICSKCLLSVNQSYAFKEQCEQADTTLRQYAQRMNEVSGETSTNREPRELIANDSLSHIEDFGNKYEEEHGDYDLDFSYRKLAIFPMKNIQQTNQNIEKRFLESPVKKTVCKGVIKINRREKLGLTEEKPVIEIESELNGKLNKGLKINTTVAEGFEKSDSFDSSILKALSEKKVEDVIVAADVLAVLDEDCELSDSGCDGSSVKSEKFLGRKNFFVQVNVSGKEKLKERKSGSGKINHFELLQSLMKNKNIVVPKRASYLSDEIFLPEKISPFKNENFSLKKGLFLPYDFKIAQLLKEWEKVSKRISKIKKTEEQAVCERNNDVIVACYDSLEDNEVSRGVESFLKQKNVTNQKRSIKDTVYCKDCRIFLLRTSYGSHIKFVHKKIRKYLCQTCGYAACTGTILRQHVQAVHVGYSFFCDQCPRKFNLLKRLRKHVEFHHSGKPVEKNHICQYCGMAFAKPGCLKRHLRSHTQEAPYQCQYCQRRFKYQWPKKQHERLHTGEKPYKCSYCEERFTQNCLRKAHEYKKHGNEEFRPKARVKEESATSQDLKETYDVEPS